MIEYKLYSKQLEQLEIADGFFEGWPNCPDKATHRKILENSYKSIVAIANQQIIGFINIVSDGVLCAYFPLLEVIPAYHKQGIGKKLVTMALAETKDLYMIDLSCDDDVVAFYKKLSFHQSNSMFIRNYQQQAGKKEERNIYE